jgi:hypothetical protein
MANCFHFFFDIPGGEVILVIKFKGFCKTQYMA